MRVSLFRAICVSAAVSIGCTGSSEAASPSTDGGHDAGVDPCTDLHVAAQALVDSERAASAIPGLIFAIDTPRCGTIATTSGYANVATKAPMTIDTGMSIASVTKTFVAALVLRLAERGKLSLDDTLSKWEPSIVGANTITVRQMLGHRSGIPDYLGDSDCYPSHVIEQSTPRDLLDCIRGDPLLFAPGTGWSYSSSNYVLLGLIAEAVTGASLNDAIRSEFLASLHLDHTGFGTDAALPYATAARVYDQDDDVTGIWNASYVWAGGHMVSITPDMLAWIRALVGGNVLGEASKAVMQDFRPSASWFPDGDYGLGLVSRTLTPVGSASAFRIEGHPGRWDAMSEVYFVPAWNASVVLLMNERVQIAAHSANIDLPNEMLDRLLVALAPAVEATRLDR